MSASLKTDGREKKPFLIYENDDVQTNKKLRGVLKWRHVTSQSGRSIFNVPLTSVSQLVMVKLSVVIKRKNEGISREGEG